MRAGKTRILSNLSVGSSTVGSGKVVDISSVVAGLGLPTMTTTQRDAIPSPSAGITIYNTTTSQIEYYDGTDWIRVVAGELAFTLAFTNADLSGGVLTVTHNLGFRPVVVQVYNDDWDMIMPDEITLTSTNVATVALNSFGTITGTWNVIVYAPPDGSATPGTTFIPVVADFPTQVGFGSNSAATDSANGIVFSNFGDAGERAACLMMPYPTPPFTVIMGVRTFFGLSNHSMPGIAIGDSATTQLILFGKLLYNGATPFYERYMTNPTTNSGDGNFITCSESEIVYFKYTDDGTNRRCYTGFSPDPNDFITINDDSFRFQESNTNFLTPDQIGIFMWTALSQMGVGVFAYYRTYNSIV